MPSPQLSVCPPPPQAAVDCSTMSSALPDAVNYHAWILEVLGRWIGPGPLLEVGPGYGQYTRAIAPKVERVTAVDCDPVCVQRLRGTIGNVEARVGDITDPDLAVRLGAGAFETVVCLNVLEHIEKDATVLRFLRRVLRPEGRLLLVVPAHPALYGPMDRLAGHYRRYTRSVLRQKLVAAGFTVVLLRYFNPLGGLAWWVNSRLFKPKGLSDPLINRQIMLFDRFVQPISRRIDPLTRGFFGQSLWAVATPRRAG